MSWIGFFCQWPRLGSLGPKVEPQTTLNLQPDLNIQSSENENKEEKITNNIIFCFKRFSARKFLRFSVEEEAKGILETNCLVMGIFPSLKIN